MATILCPQELSKIYRLAVATGLVFFAGLISAFAAEPLKVTVHQSYLVQLQQDADIIMVGNPTIADIAVESARMFFLLGLEPGETNLHILNSRGDTIMETAIVVVPTSERTVTVNRANNLEEATYSCSPRCAAVGSAVGVGAAPPTGGGDSEAASAEAEAPITEGTEDTTTEGTTGG